MILLQISLMLLTILLLFEDTLFWYTPLVFEFGLVQNLAQKNGWYFLTVALLPFDKLNSLLVERLIALRLNQ